jgi:hypothetical protein
MKFTIYACLMVIYCLLGAETFSQPPTNSKDLTADISQSDASLGKPSEKSSETRDPKLDLTNTFTPKLAPIFIGHIGDMEYGKLPLFVMPIFSREIFESEQAYSETKKIVRILSAALRDYLFEQEKNFRIAIDRAEAVVGLLEDPDNQISRRSAFYSDIIDKIDLSLTPLFAWILAELNSKGIGDLSNQSEQLVDQSVLYIINVLKGMLGVHQDVKNVLVDPNMTISADDLKRLIVDMINQFYRPELSDSPPHVDAFITAIQDILGPFVTEQIDVLFELADRSVQTDAGQSSKTVKTSGTEKLHHIVFLQVKDGLLKMANNFERIVGILSPLVDTSHKQFSKLWLGAYLKRLPGYINQLNDEWNARLIERLDKKEIKLDAEAKLMIDLVRRHMLKLIAQALEYRGYLVIKTHEHFVNGKSFDSEDLKKQFAEGLKKINETYIAEIMTKYPESAFVNRLFKLGQSFVEVQSAIFADIIDAQGCSAIKRLRSS